MDESLINIMDVMEPVISNLFREHHLNPSR